MGSVTRKAPRSGNTPCSSSPKLPWQGRNPLDAGPPASSDPRMSQRMNFGFLAEHTRYDAISRSARPRHHMCRPTRRSPLPRRTPAGEWTTATSWSPGSRLHVPASPSQVRNTQWSRCEHAAHSCGGSPGVVFIEDGTRFPIESLIGTLVARAYDVPIAFGASTGADSFDGPAATSYRTARTRCPLFAGD